jgi:hypothetical protein
MLAFFMIFWCIIITLCVYGVVHAHRQHVYSMQCNDVHNNMHSERMDMLTTCAHMMADMYKQQ